MARDPYAKIYDTIYDGTLPEVWEALVTFQQLLILKDRDGEVDMTREFISRRTGIPLDIIEKGIEVLESPDPNSGSPEFGGRRILRLDDHRTWGWFIVNHDTFEK